MNGVRSGYVETTWECGKCGKTHTITYKLRRGQPSLTAKLSCKTCGEGHTLTLALPYVQSDTAKREQREREKQERARKSA